MKTTWHIARSDGGRLLFFAGFAPGGELTVSDDKEKAVTFASQHTARQFAAELMNSTGDGWFPMQFAEEET